MFSRLPMVNEWTNSCFWCWRQLRHKLKCQVTTTIMSCRLRRLRSWEVYLMFVETQMRYNRHSRPIEVKGSPLARVGRRCCVWIIEARQVPVLWARRDKHARIRWPPCAVKTAPVKKRDWCKKRGATLACILYCIYARVLYVISSFLVTRGLHINKRPKPF